MRVYSLSFHANYACRHSGACCTSRWPIPVEQKAYVQLSELIAGGSLLVRNPDPFTAIRDAPADTPVVATLCADGACAFYERDTGLCAIHRQAGASLLPVACRQFPRVSLLDARGLFVSLSHYCPTAADLLFRDGTPLEIVEAPAAFPEDFEYEPLDAREALSPLLRPDVLLDLESFDRWEREAVALLARDDLSPERALAALAAFTELVRRWGPERGDFPAYLEEITRTGSEVARAGNQDEPIDQFVVRAHCAIALGAIPEGIRGAAPSGDFDAEAYRQWVEPRWRLFAAPIRRYLAARLFGSWLAYQGRGLRTIVFSLEVGLSLLRASAARECATSREPLGRETLLRAIRRTDEILLHLASRERLARALGRVERRHDAPASP